MCALVCTHHNAHVPVRTVQDPAIALQPAIAHALVAQRRYFVSKLADANLCVEDEAGTVRNGGVGQLSEVYPKQKKIKKNATWLPLIGVQNNRVWERGAAHP